jgi:hypothetical protein
MPTHQEEAGERCPEYNIDPGDPTDPDACAELGPDDCTCPPAYVLLLIFACLSSPYTCPVFSCSVPPWS